MKHKVVSYESQQQPVVTVYAFDEAQKRYLIRVERRFFGGTQHKLRDRYVEDMLAKYGALGEVHLCVMDDADEWDPNDPQQRDRRGLDPL